MFGQKSGRLSCEILSQDERQSVRTTVRGYNLPRVVVIYFVGIQVLERSLVQQFDLEVY
jgi:hypothetical protein